VISSATMATIDQLETTRASLQSNGIELLSATVYADSQLQILVVEEVLAQQAIDATKERYRKLSILSTSICSDCWVILPGLGPEVYQKAEEQARNVLSDGTGSDPVSCVNCGASGVSLNQNTRGAQRHHQRTSIKVPPKISRLLDKSKDIRQESRKILNATAPYQGRRGGSTSWGTYASSESDGSWSDYNTEDENDDCTMATLGKMDYLVKVSKQTKRARKRLENVKLAIEIWTIHKVHHETELGRVTKAIKKVTAKECRLLEERLEKLGASKSRSICPTSSAALCCDICWDNNNNSKVVFQCGHHCCSDCANEMTNCHMCRKRIKQRIQLFE
jgi:hypothetical protein